MKHKIKHDFNLDLAVKITELALSTYQEKYSQYKPMKKWTSLQRVELSFNVNGFNILGSIDVGVKSIDLKFDLPFLLLPFKQKAISIVESEFVIWIAKAKAGKLVV